VITPKLGLGFGFATVSALRRSCVQTAQLGLMDAAVVAVRRGVSPPEQPEFETGTAGASARREHERRRASREARVRGKHPHLGGLLLALGDQPRRETAWTRGAEGEATVARSLSNHLQDSAVVLHDRRIPRSRANIDHIAIAPSGVWVIDSKRYKGKVAVSKPLFWAAEAHDQRPRQDQAHRRSRQTGHGRRFHAR
jgi:nuclease-like protein